MQNILKIYVNQSITNVLCIVSMKLSIFVLKYQVHTMTRQYCIWQHAAPTCRPQTSSVE